MIFPWNFDPHKQESDVTQQNNIICYVGRIQTADVSSLNIRILFFSVI